MAHAVVGVNAFIANFKVIRIAVFFLDPLTVDFFFFHFDRVAVVFKEVGVNREISHIDITIANRIAVRPFNGRLKVVRALWSRPSNGEVTIWMNIVHHIALGGIATRATNHQVGKRFGVSARVIHGKHVWRPNDSECS